MYARQKWSRNPTIVSQEKHDKNTGKKKTIKCNAKVKALWNKCRIPRPGFYREHGLVMEEKNCIDIDMVGDVYMLREGNTRTRKRGIVGYVGRGVVRNIRYGRKKGNNNVKGKQNVRGLWPRF